MTEEDAAIEYLTKRHAEQCEIYPLTRGIPLALYLRRNMATVISNWRARANAERNQDC